MHTCRRPQRRHAPQAVGRREKALREQRAVARESLYSGPEYAAARIKYANDVLKTCCIEIDAEGKLNGCRAQARSRSSI